MHRICTKYAKNICTNMQIYAIYMQKYANICSTVCATEICKNMQKYAKYMHAICKNMQNMQSRFLYAEYAKICTPHFADVTQCKLLWNAQDKLVILKKCTRKGDSRNTFWFDSTMLFVHPLRGMKTKTIWC